MKLRPFELALVIIFLLTGLTALFFIANYSIKPKQGDGPANVGSVQIWGTLPQKVVDGALSRFMSVETVAYRGISYQYFPPDQFDDALLNALADQRGPDLILTSHEKLVDLRGRIQPISYESFPYRDIQNIFIDGAAIFALSDGLYALPLVVDPLMMYWNKRIITTAGFLSPPETWDQLVQDYFSTLVELNADRTVSRSVVAMGEYQNVRNAFGVLSALMLQAGTFGVSEGTTDHYYYRIKLRSSVSEEVDPVYSAFDFYSRFGKSTNALYNWNRALPEDRAAFISNDLMFYFGYASEGQVIERLNPNLDFDIAEIPQGSDATARRTYGRFYGLSLMKNSSNRNGALMVMNLLSGQDTSRSIADLANMVSVYRSEITAGSDDSYGRFAYRSAPIAFGWLSPVQFKVNDIFRVAIEDINGNRESVASAVTDTEDRLMLVYPQ